MIGRDIAYSGGVAGAGHASVQAGERERVPSGGRSGARRTLAALVLFALCGAALVAGGWGVISSLGGGREVAPASIGEPVAVEGGSMRVDAYTPEHMAHPQTGKFAASGMSMSAMGVDMAAEGKERFAVEVTLAADEGGALSYSPDDFLVSGKGFEKASPVRHQLGGGTVPAGSAVSGNLVFEVPDDAKDLALGFDGGRPVSLELKPGKDGGQGKDKGHGH